MANSPRKTNRQKKQETLAGLLPVDYARRDYSAFRAGYSLHSTYGVTSTST